MSSAEENRAFVRQLIGRRGMTDDIEAFARTLVEVRTMIETDDGDTWGYEPAWADAADFSDDELEYDPDSYPEVWQDSDANPEG